MAKRRVLRQENLRKAAEAVFIVQIWGALLLLPPILNLFNTRSLLFGVPLEAVYLFMVWTVLIACAVAISAKMPRVSASAQPEEDTAALTSRPNGESG